MLGLGRGFEPAMLRAFGVDPREKRDRFDAALDAILCAWGDEDEAARPLQRPHPPLFVAAFGPKGLAQAARRGLPYLASPLESLATLERNFTRYAELRAGDPLDSPAPHAARPVAVMRTVHVTANAAETRHVRDAAEAEFATLAARAGGAIAAVATGLAADRVLIGEVGEVADLLAQYRERLGLDLLVLRPAARVDSEARRSSLERLVDRVLPIL